MKNIFWFLFLGMICFSVNIVVAQEDIKEYTVKRTVVPVVIDGILDEDSWQAAPLTTSFVEQQHGDSVPHNTQAKMLWDDQYLYIGFICDDPDVWSTYTERDAHMWDEENVEIFGDPDGDGKYYFEIEFNPLGAIFDELVDHSWMEGENNEDVGWNLKGLEVAVSVMGTINNVSDRDTGWICEAAIPFDSLDASINPSQEPPAGGDIWRLQLGHYNRPRDGQGNVTGDPETSVWNMTGTPWFHVPSRFGRIIFSDETVTTVRGNVIKKGEEDFSWNLYPNPVRSSSTIRFYLHKESFVKIHVLNVTGKVVDVICEDHFPEGSHVVTWSPVSLPPGVYICHLSKGTHSDVKKMVVIREYPL